MLSNKIFDSDAIKLWRVKFWYPSSIIQVHIGIKRLRSISQSVNYSQSKFSIPGEIATTNDIGSPKVHFYGKVVWGIGGWPHLSI